MKTLAASLPTGARRGLSCGVALLALAAAQPAMAQPVGQDEAARQFHIPAQDASSALLQLCRTAGCELAFVRGDAGDVQTRAVNGRMGWRSALSRMLEGTGLRYRFVGARGVRVWMEVAPAPAAATPVEATEVESVIVVGRLSGQIDAALRRKRAADVISDGLSTERIGALPAANLAEALQRLPGVAIEREVGEGQFVSVRGVGPLFQSVTLNGAPVAFNENIRNSTQSGRQFRFRALSVDLLAGAVLTKTATPDLIDGGIGANIDIETAGGLDGDPFASVQSGGQVEMRTGRVNADVSLAGRIVSADANRGLIGGVSQETRSVRYDRFQIQRYSEQEIGDRTLIAPNDVRTTVESEERRRRSAFVGADWRVSPDLRLDFDGLVSTFDNAIREDRLVYGLGERLEQPGAAVEVRDGVVTAARISDGRIDNNTEVSDQAHLNVAASLGAELRLGEWRLTPRISGSLARSVLDTPLERLSTQSPQGVAYAFDLGDASSSRKAARLTTDYDLLDPAALTLAQLNIRAVESRDDDVTVFLDARRTLDRTIGGVGLASLRLGGQFSDRGRDYQRRDRRATPRSAQAGVADLYRSITPGDVFAQLIEMRSTPWVAAEFGLVDAAFVVAGEVDGVVFTPDDVQPTGADRQNSYGVREQVAAAYVRLDIDTMAYGRRVSGNLGARLVHTRTRVEGARLEASGDAAAVEAVRFEGDHDILLPSLNLAVDLDHGAMLRLAASRSLTRPSLADLRASTVPASVLVSNIYTRGQAAIDDPAPGVIFSGVGGNPHLTPYVSTNLDFSYERMDARGGFSVAIFHKTIDDFIDYVAAPERLTFETQAGPAVQADVMMSRPRNVGRALVDGLEIGLNRRFGAGLGLWASAMLSDSRLADGGRLTGVSALSWSISPFVERGPWTANLSWSWRSPFRSEADMQGGGVSEFIVGSAGYLDAQASIDLSSHAQVVVALSNITDTRDLAWEMSRSRLLQIGQAGRELSMSLRWAW